MFSISTRPPHTALRFDEPVNGWKNETSMDVDEDDLGEGPSTSGPRSVVSPGEAITSAREYMRWVGPCFRTQIIRLFQGSWNLCRGRIRRVLCLWHDSTSEQAHLGQADQVEVGQARPSTLTPGIHQRSETWSSAVSVKSALHGGKSTPMRVKMPSSCCQVSICREEFSGERLNRMR